MELRIYLAIVRKWLWLILLCGGLSSSMTYFFTSRQPPIYQANARLLVSDGSNLTDIWGYYNGEYLATTYAERLLSPTVEQEVMERLGLEEWSWSASVSPLRSTPLLNLTVEDTNPEIAMQVANLIPVVFVDANRDKLQNEFNRTEDILGQEIERLRGDIDATQEMIKTLEDQESPNQAQLDRLYVDLQEYQNSYVFFTRNYQDLRIAQVQLLNPVILDQPAELPLAPIGPRVMMNTLLAAILGVMVGLGAGFVVEYLDDTIKSSTDLVGMFGLGTLAIVGRSKEKSSYLLTQESDLHTTLAEAYRMLRTNIRFASVDNQYRTLVVTSPRPGEGKSTISANLAVVMAQQGHRTILVDADLRRPVQHKVFKVSAKSGLTTALVERERPADAFLQQTAIQNLQILPAGPLPPNPSELLGSQRMNELLQELEGLADFVIIDSAPVLAVSDASVLANSAQGVVLVLRANQTNFEALDSTLTQLSSIQASILGCVLNDVESNGDGYYYYSSNSSYATPPDPPTGGTPQRGSLMGRMRGVLLNSVLK